MFWKRFGIFALSLLPLAALHAGPILDFGIPALNGGTVSFGGGASPLIGSGITIADVTGIDTPLHDNESRTCITCTLGFTTGPLVMHSSNLWVFAAGGSLDVHGGIDLNQNHLIGSGEPTGTLLTGSFDEETIVVGSSGGFRVLAAAYQDNVIPSLLQFFGSPVLPGYPDSGALNLQFKVTLPRLVLADSTNSFVSSKVLSGDLTSLQPTPEPASLLLIGSGFVLGVLNLRRLRRCGIQSVKKDGINKNSGARRRHIAKF